MSVKVKDIIKVIEAFSPAQYASKWDNCGLQIGEMDGVVDKLLLALSPSDEVIDYAIEQGFDMILTHHPLTITKYGQVNSQSLFGRKAIKLIKNNIVLYSAHTNLDVVANSINDYLIDLFGFKKEAVLSPTVNEEIGFGFICSLEKELSLVELTKHIKDKLGLQYIGYAGDDNQMISRVAICSGSGVDFLETVAEQGVHSLITGDLKYHGALDATELGVSIIDGTHFATENVVMYIFERLLKEKSTDVDICLDPLSKNPIKIL